MFAILEDPLPLAVAFASVTLLSLPLGRRTAGRMWGTAGTVYGCYILTSSLCALLALDILPFAITTLGCSALYMIFVGGVVQVLIKLFKIQGSSEGAMVFLIIIYHPITLLVAAGIRWVYLAITG
ncbi:MAG: hypothetical protein AB8H80_07245 [Planctomycetota bacterium]